MIERQIISASNNQEIVKFAFMSTPNFMSNDGESLTKVILWLLNDGTLTIHSAISGNFIEQLDLKNYTNINTARDEIIDIQTTSAGNEFSLIILSINGDVHIVNFDLKRLELRLKNTIDPLFNYNKGYKIMVLIRIWDWHALFPELPSRKRHG